MYTYQIIEKLYSLGQPLLASIRNSIDKREKWIGNTCIGASKTIRVSLRGLIEAAYCAWKKMAKSTKKSVLLQCENPVVELLLLFEAIII